MGEFFLEAAVLVGVFGLLDPVLKGGRIGFFGMLAAVAIAFGLFLVGLFLTFRAEAHR